MANNPIQQQEKLVATVRKLLALADQSRNDNEHQAQAALDKANELMEEHGLQMAQIHLEEGTDWDVVDWMDKERSQYDSYVQILAQATARLFNCKNYQQKGGYHNKYRVRMGFIGDKADISMVQEIWPWLVKRAKRLAIIYCGKGWSPSHRSFAEGFAYRVFLRADDLSKTAAAKSEPEATVVKGDSVTTALVVAGKKDAIEQWLENSCIRFSKSRKHSNRGAYDHQASSAGKLAGNEVNLNFKKNLKG